MEACEVGDVRVGLDDLERLTDAQLESLLGAVDKAMIALDGTAGVGSYELEAKDSSKQQVSYFKELDDITGDLEAKRIGLDAYDKRMHDAIHTNFTRVYSANRDRPLDEGDLEYLRRATAEEMRYARGFGSDIAEDRLRMPRRQRAGMYAATLGGIGDHARVEASPDDSEFDWKLGVAEHCPDCLVLAANSPYTKLTLSTTPRAGATRCLSKCMCKLIVHPGKLTKAQLADMREYGMRKDQTLSEMLEPGLPPKGMRLPTDVERRYIDGLRMKINTNRRIIGTSTDKARIKEAIKARKAANAELIEFTEKHSVYDVPVWSVDDVLDGRHVGRRVVQEVFHHGIDGRSLDLAGKRQLLSMLGEYERQVGGTLSDDVLKKALKEEAD